MQEGKCKGYLLLGYNSNLFSSYNEVTKRTIQV